MMSKTATGNEMHIITKAGIVSRYTVASQTILSIAKFVTIADKKIAIK